MWAAGATAVGAEAAAGTAVAAAVGGVEAKDMEAVVAMREVGSLAAAEVAAEVAEAREGAAAELAAARAAAMRAAAAAVARVKEVADGVAQLVGVPTVAIPGAQAVVVDAAGRVAGSVVPVAPAEGRAMARLAVRALADWAASRARRGCGKRRPPRCRGAASLARGSRRCPGHRCH